MTTEEEALINGKKFEARIALFLLIPPILGVISFVLCLFDCEWHFAKMRDLSSEWTGSAPIYLGLMAIAGVLLLKDSSRYLFLNSEKPEEGNNTNPASD